MGKFLIVSNIERLQEHLAISKKYGLGFEYNDFYKPEVINNASEKKNIINKYLAADLPDYSTLHGAFFDVIVFSYDEKIREISEKRIIESMEIARKIGAKGVVFHTNANPFLAFMEYENRTIEMTINFFSGLLENYSDINIYIENMFDSNPRILKKISEKLIKYHNYGICFDYAHAMISNTPIIEWINELSSYIKHIHINDNDLKNDLHLSIGEGKINWDEFKKFYLKYFTECTVLIETSLPENQVKSIEYIRNLLNE